jgi:hypothetical protein
MNDSTEKIITTYFRGVTEESFIYRKKTYDPCTLIVSPLLLRGTTCPENCGACCKNYSMDFLPTDKLPKDYPGVELVEKIVDFNNKKYLLYTIKRNDPNATKCEQMNEAGRCTIHLAHALSCDFELIRFLHPKLGSSKPSHMLTRLYGRGWQMMKIDGTRGALCEVVPISKETIDDTLRKLNRLQGWCDYFEVKSKIPKIIDWINSPKNTEKLILGEISKNDPLFNI